MGIEITKAQADEYPVVRQFYHSMIDSIQDYSFKTCWEKDIYPSPDFLQSAVSRSGLFLGRIDGRIAAAMVLNHDCNPEYQSIKWQIDANRDEVLIIHALGVHHDFSGRGCGRSMVKKAIEIARNTGMKAMRLDVLNGNVYAEKLYTSCGFAYIDTIQLYYEDTGRTAFNMFELLL